MPVHPSVLIAGIQRDVERDVKQKMVAGHWRSVNHGQCRRHRGARPVRAGEEIAENHANSGDAKGPTGWVLGCTRSRRSTAAMPDPNPSANLIDIATVAERLGVEVRHVRRLVAERRIPYIKWGHLLRFDPADV
ncbi:MAG: helix-turn-helix domain-containing protein, partial [Acidimicrobiia bacterium]